MKNLLQMTWLFFLLIIASATMAQNPEFNLKNYKTTNYERSNLDLLFNLKESAFNFSNEIDNSLIYLSSNRNFIGNYYVVSDFSKILYSNKKIISYGGNLSLSNNNSKQLDHTIDSMTITK
jgi:hypothetical protein